MTLNLLSVNARLIRGNAFDPTQTEHALGYLESVYGVLKASWIYWLARRGEPLTSIGCHARCHANGR